MCKYVVFNKEIQIVLQRNVCWNVIEIEKQISKSILKFEFLYFLWYKNKIKCYLLLLVKKYYNKSSCFLISPKTLVRLFYYVRKRHFDFPVNFWQIRFTALIHSLSLSLYLSLCLPLSHTQTHSEREIKSRENKSII